MGRRRAHKQLQQLVVPLFRNEVALSNFAPEHWQQRSATITTTVLHAHLAVSGRCFCLASLLLPPHAVLMSLSGT
eukprot:3171117-Alexandrium_andersonii.AAC.1